MFDTYEKTKQGFENTEEQANFHRHIITLNNNNELMLHKQLIEEQV